MRLTDSYRKFMGIQKPHRGPRVDGNRDANIIELYAGGNTLQEIGSIYGVSRERIRQILKRNGITSQQGGRTIKAAPNKLAEQAKRDSYWIDKYGCNYDSVKRIRVEYPKATRQFSMQRRNSRQRGIDWLITLAEWMEIWLSSGHYYERGISNGQYVMARLNDSGPYAANNVKIILSSENISEAMEIFKAKGKEWFGGKNKEKHTHCKRGHEFTEANSYVHAKTGNIQCRACMSIRSKEKYYRDLEKSRKDGRLRMQRKKLAQASGSQV